ncbi:PIG-L family deacetylase [Thiocapsa rosea]|uniref:GlcNAc-PI de-N-acetylase n=1 Tax=Thiocapsa rosea TaxID=69360 RepID=A0A495VGA5_9GAMM|nr:PIG-L family deacetylase [Thiocapsa rosea]RKT47475.1 GlcNAc-PI de-N-acetylase [Thiocapsa rosea]
MNAGPFRSALPGDDPSGANDAEDTLRLADAILVVAHPDDEILWFSSVVGEVSKVIVVYSENPNDPGLGQKRDELFAAYPLDTAELIGLAECRSFNTAGWPNARRSAYGLELIAPLTVRDAYRHNYERLATLLDEALKNAQVVLTHSPWGDYGHEDHVQVYAAVAAAQHKHGFQIWYPGYVSDRSWQLMQKSVLGFSHTYTTMNTNLTLAYDLAALYRDYDCWTWYDDYVWPTHETFFLDSDLVSATTSTTVGGNFPVNVLRLGLRPRPARPHILSRIVKRLRNG